MTTPRNLTIEPEGDHYRPDGSQFAVEWRDDGWYWSNFIFNAAQDFVGPFAIAENCYLDALGEY